MKRINSISPEQLFISLVMFIVSVFPVHAEEVSEKAPRFVAVTSDNDNYVSRHDRHYTNGLRLSAGLPVGSSAPWRDWLGNLLPLVDNPDAREYTLSLGQNIYTPANFASRRPQTDDRPFAGWLYGELAVTAYAPGVMESLVLNVGIIGPASFGREAQELIHAVTGDADPDGWRNQLDTEPALLLHYSRNWFLGGKEYEYMDFLPGVGVSLGNVVTEVSASALMRIGSFLPQKHPPVSIQPSGSQASRHFVYRDGHTDWMVYFGGGARAVAHNIFLDGNTLSDSLSVDKKPVVWNAVAGLTLTFGQADPRVQFSFACILESKEFDQQEEMDRYGSVTISLQY